MEYYHPEYGLIDSEGYDMGGHYIGLDYPGVKPYGGELE